MSLQERFETYFQRPIVVQATRSLSNGVGIEFRVSDSKETFHFTRQAGSNRAIAGPAPHPEIVFTLSESAAEALLTDPSEEVGAIGINVIKQILAKEPERKIDISLKVGFFALFTQGYLGVLKEGGGSFAAFLASKGLNGIDSIKSVIKKLKGHA